MTILLVVGFLLFSGIALVGLAWAVRLVNQEAALGVFGYFVMMATGLALPAHLLAAGVLNLLVTSGYCGWGTVAVAGLINGFLWSLAFGFAVPLWVGPPLALLHFALLRWVAARDFVRR